MKYNAKDDVDSMLKRVYIKTYCECYVNERRWSKDGKCYTCGQPIRQMRRVKDEIGYLNIIR